MKLFSRAGLKQDIFHLHKWFPSGGSKRGRWIKPVSLYYEAPSGSAEEEEYAKVPFSRLRQHTTDIISSQKGVIQN
jgi:hypothetical protein